MDLQALLGLVSWMWTAVFLKRAQVITEMRTEVLDMKLEALVLKIKDVGRDEV